VSGRSSDPRVGLERSTLRGPLGIALAALAGVLLRGSTLLSPEYAIDDAWISFRVARNWLAGHGLVFEPTLPPAEGMTNLLWTLLSATWIAGLGELEPLLVARLVGWAAMAGAVVLLVLLAARLAERASVGAAVTAALLVANGGLVYHALSGLETGLWALLFALALWLALGVERPDPARCLATGGALALLAATRPEGVLAGAVFCAAWWLRDRRAAALAGAAFAPGVAILEGFRWTTYGALVPNTFHAKPPGLGMGLEYLGSFLAWGLAGGTAIVLAALAWRRHPRLRPALITAVVLVAGATWSGGDWMVGFRRFTLAFLVAALAAGVTVSGWPRTSRRAGRALWLVVGAWLACLATASVLGWDRARIRHGFYRELALAAAQEEEVRTVALLDIGEFGWYFPRSILDLAGLTDPHIARLEGQRHDKPFDAAYVEARRPELILVRADRPFVGPILDGVTIGSPDHEYARWALARQDWTYHSSHRYQAGKWLWLFRHRSVELDPEVWGPGDAAPPAR
jgi:arabinofuranosyltransferase